MAEKEGVELEFWSRVKCLVRGELALGHEKCGIVVAEEVDEGAHGLNAGARLFLQKLWTKELKWDSPSSRMRSRSERTSRSAPKTSPLPSLADCQRKKKSTSPYSATPVQCAPPSNTSSATATCTSHGQMPTRP